MCVLSRCMRSCVILALLAAITTGCSDDEGTTKPETTVSYVAHVQPIFDANCTNIGCHAAPFPAEGLDLTTYDALDASNTNDRIYVPGNAEESEIIERLTGQSMPQMPLNEDPLRDGQIDTIRIWINEGALDN